MMLMEKGLANIYFSSSLLKIDNVARFLRYLQPEGGEVTMAFLQKSTETREYLICLEQTEMSAATRLNYIKNMIRFVDYLKTRLDMEQEVPNLHTMCQKYKEFLQTLRKPVAKAHSRAVVSTK